jgi:3-oxoadipate enol-lactonase
MGLPPLATLFSHPTAAALRPSDRGLYRSCGVCMTHQRLQCAECCWSRTLRTINATLQFCPTAAVSALSWRWRPVRTSRLCCSRSPGAASRRQVGSIASLPGWPYPWRGSTCVRRCKSTYRGHAAQRSQLELDWVGRVLTLHTRNIETYYATVGSGEPLLFIHGLGSTADGWTLQVPAFADTHRVITYDLRGHGRSSHPPGPYSIPQLAADAASLLDELATGPTHVVGLSLGGAVAFQLALDRPRLVHTLTVVNSAPGLELTSLGDRLRWYAAVATRLVLSRVLSMRRLGEVVARRLFPEPEQGQLRAVFVKQFARNDRHAYDAAARALFAWNVLERIGEVGCPTLIVSADHDYTPVALKAAYVARMPNAVLEVIENSRHATPLDRPDRFNAVLRDFLERYPLGAAAASPSVTFT